MTRPRRARTAILLCIVCVFTHVAVQGQSDGREYSVSWLATAVGGRYVGTPPRTWQLFREDLVEVEIAISLANEGRDALYFNTGMVERAMRFRLFWMDEVNGDLQERPVAVTSHGIMNRAWAGPLITLPDQLLLAEGKGKGMLVWIMAATQPDGRPFPPGRYRFEIELHDIRSAIVTFTGERLPDMAFPYWSGVATGDLDLVVAAPSTPAQVATMYVQRGDVAFERRQFDEAVTLFRQAADADPSDAHTALHRLGKTYVTLGRYAEAVPVLQRLPMPGTGVIESLLALAHFGAGNEAEATSLLRGLRLSERQVVAELEGMRQLVRERPAR